MAERDTSNETPNRRDNEEEIVGQPVNQKDEEFEGDDVTEDIDAEEGE